ncbi:hypothetical protein OGATHE_003557 [Ogataea polymorpha]|uniref:Uncharacterized protein n=1 Tax=Ogataea polymorpha TaxID=460523 RepID=A0A9P8P3W9_9ASCO|nr:hypothetical protein OGATHE_003557 [Ogataea polymorpha]
MAIRNPIATPTPIPAFAPVERTEWGECGFCGEVDISRECGVRISDHKWLRVVVCGHFEFLEGACGTASRNSGNSRVCGIIR